MRFDEYYLTENEEKLKLSLDQFILVKKSIDGVLYDIKIKKTSRSTKPIEVWKVKNKYLVVDGWHRFVEGILKGQNFFDVIQVGEGYSDYYKTSFSIDEIYATFPFSR